MKPAPRRREREHEHEHDDAPGAALAHFVIFNPSLAVKRKQADQARNSVPGDGPGEANESGVRSEAAAAAGGSAPPDGLDVEPLEAKPAAPDADLEDDLREARQILFYTSREARGVSRDTMLRQVGLAKGLMGFADMVAPGETKSPKEPVYWAVHSQQHRMIVYSPEPEWFIYVCISLPKESKDKEAPKPPEPALSDRMLVQGLQRGYDAFCLLHSTFASHLPPTPALTSLLDRHWTRFAFAYEEAYIATTDPLLTWLGGWPTLPSQPALDALLATLAGDGAAGILTPSGPVAVSGTFPASRPTAALIQHLLSRLSHGLPPAVEAKPAHTEKPALSFAFRRRRDPPAPVSQGHDRKTSWGLSPLSWVGLGSQPTSRSVTPAPATPTPVTPAASAAQTPGTPKERSPDGSAASSLRAGDSLRPVAAAGQKPRWPSLGLGGLGDAMGNVGAALGLSGSSSPKPDRDVEDKEGQVEGTEKADADEEPKEGGEQAEEEDADQTPSETSPPQPGSFSSSVFGRSPPGDGAGEAAEGIPTLATSLESKTSLAVTAAVHAAKEAEAEAEAVAEAAPVAEPKQGTDAKAQEGTESEAEATPLATTESLTPTAAVGVDADVPSAVEAAADDEIALPWESKEVYLPHPQRVFWVIRDRVLLFVLRPPSSTSEPPKAQALAALRAIPPAPEPEPRSPATSLTHRIPSNPVHNPLSRERDKEEDSTVYHLGNVTDVSGPLDRDETATLAALRRGLDDGVGEIYAQLGSGRFGVVKRAEPSVFLPLGSDGVGEDQVSERDAKGEKKSKDGSKMESGRAEFFALTARRDAGLTDAERLVRAVALVRPEFT